MNLRFGLRVAVLVLLIVSNREAGAQGRSNSTLPVMFDNVRISLKNGSVLIEWSNLTERELVNYVVERSSDAQSYKELSRFVPRSNQNEPMSYSDVDPSPAAGLNYYRIKVNEISGKVIVSKVLKIETFRETTGFSVYPNPVISGQLSWSVSNVNPGKFNLSVLGMGGMPVYNEVVSIQGKSAAESLELPYNLCSGMYRLVLSSADVLHTRTFIVQ